METLKETENLKRREDLRKGESAAGGRRKYISPLELFQMQLDAETTPKQSLGQEAIEDMENIDDDSEWEETAPSSLRSRSQPDLGRYRPEAHSGMTIDSWLKCMFPFKKIRRTLKFATKPLKTMETKKDSNSLPGKGKLRKSKSKATEQVEMSAVSASKKSESKLRRRHVEVSDGSKKISAMSDNKAYARGNPYIDPICDEFDASYLVEIYRHRGIYFPFGRKLEITETPIERTKRSKIGMLRRAFAKTRYPEESIHGIAPASPDSTSKKPSTAVRFQRQQSVDRRRVVASRVTGINSKTKSIPYGRVRPMAPDSEKRGTMLSRSPGMLEDSDPGFQAIVPFQGFAAFAYQGGNGRADAPHNRSLESQTSSTVGSHNSSASKR